MIPVIALVGRPNVGKSTLFNRLTKSRDALVANQPGLTRDRQYGQGQLGSRPYIVIDTGGIGQEDENIDELMVSQVEQALTEADIIFFLVDGRDGLLPTDERIAQRIRKLNKPIHLIINKIDGLDEATTLADFYTLGFAEPKAIAASQGRGVQSLMRGVLEALPESEVTGEHEKDMGIKIAVVGRPNVGKSTLINRLLGEERVVVYDLPGTTRDSIFIPLKRDDKHYTLIDTAGVRKRGRVNRAVEKFSVVQTLKAIKEADVVIAVIDASEAVTEQDCHLLDFIETAGRALVIALNKWDGLSADKRQAIYDEVDRKLPFIDYAKRLTISALHGTGVGLLLAEVEKAHVSSCKSFTTALLNKLLAAFTQAHEPPLKRGRRIKLRYAHQGGKQPPRIIIHGNQVTSLPMSYKRYLHNAYRKALDIPGSPLVIELKQGENPYAGKKNILTPRQARKRKRMLKHVKKKK